MDNGITLSPQERIRTVTPALLAWFRREQRVMPWRTDPTPYHVWLSEIMLQQTRVAAVTERYSEFLREVPDIPALAALPEDRLMKLWEGLGYYSRARNLQKAARVITERFGGVFPSSYDEIRALPGIGDYTAGAIGAIAFSIPVPCVDGNVLRVLARLNGDERDIGAEETKRSVREMLLPVIPHECPGEFDQALMELGALVCLPNGEPLCGQCPWREECLSWIEGTWERIPVRAPAKARRVEQRCVWLILGQGTVLLHRRPGKGLLAGMWEFPNSAAGEACPFPDPEIIREGPSGKHIFTHIEWHMHSLIARDDGHPLPEGWMRATLTDLREEAAIPNAFAFIRSEAERILEETEY